MQIPSINAYPMPKEQQVPLNATGWQIDVRRCVLLVHDMQNYFLDMFPQASDPMTTLLKNTARLRDGCRAAGVPVAYTAQPGGMTTEQRGLLRDFWGRGMSDDPHARAIVPPLAPVDGEPVFTKWRYSAFHRTGLLDFLRQNKKDQLIVCGVYAHIGCLITATDAYSHDIQPFLAADAVADFSVNFHSMALEYAAARCSVAITTDSVLTALLPAGVER